MKSPAMLPSIVIHAIVICAYIIFEVVFVLLMGGKGTFLDFASYYVVNIGFFYLTSLVLVPFALKRRGVYWLLPALLLLDIVIHSLFIYSLSAVKDLMADGHINRRLFFYDVMRSFWRAMNILVYSLAYSFAVYSIRKTRETKGLEIQKLVLENAYLKAQLNPHLMFNALHIIHSAVEDTSEKAGGVVLLVADFLKYAMQPPEPDGKVSLQSEVKQIERYIELNAFTKGKLQVIFEQVADCDCAHMRMPPMILLTLVENVYKHGELRNASTPARILLSCEEGLLRFRTENEKRAGGRLGSGRIGLENICRQLELLYGSTHEFQITEHPTKFVVDLKIKL